jgi:hypothetical protein
MTSATGPEPLTRDRILQLLSDGEFAGVGSAGSQLRLGNGDEYLDLEQLQQGVQKFRGAAALTGHVLPRKAINEDTWRRILRQLKATPP